MATMSKDDEQLARLGKSFAEADAELARKRAEESDAELAVDRAEVDRLRLARKHLPGTERAILSLFNEINRDIFQAKGKVSGWQNTSSRNDDTSGDCYRLTYYRELSMVLRDHGFSHKTTIMIGSTTVYGASNPKAVENELKVFTGGGVTGLEEDSRVIVEKVRGHLLEEIEKRFGRS